MVGWLTPCLLLACRDVAVLMDATGQGEAAVDYATGAMVNAQVGSTGRGSTASRLPRRWHVISVHVCPCVPVRFCTLAPAAASVCETGEGGGANDSKLFGHRPNQELARLSAY